MPSKCNSLNDYTKLRKMYKLISDASHIFTSVTFSFNHLISNQIVVDLGYYPVPVKNTLLSQNDKYYLGLDKKGAEYSYFLTCSELTTRLFLPTMSIPYNKYLSLGMCRNDNLSSDNQFPEIRNHLVSMVDYDVKKILLYVPTHRDYEKKGTNNKRSLLGFECDINEMGKYLKENGFLLVCKLHPKQNRKVIQQGNLPESVILHKGNHQYGLTELMKISDALVTDYTSAYIDYLLLDKPVIFNLYDLEEYVGTRGLTFMPYKSVLAGDVVNDAATFMKAVNDIDRNYSVYHEKRKFLRDLFFAYSDTDNCKRVYSFFFQNN